MKACTSCKETKDLSEFYWTTRRNGDRARHSICCVCRRAQFRLWASSERGKAVKRSGIMRREYGITEQCYSEMMARQGGVCAICMCTERKRHRTGGAVRLCVDHDHVTGNPRALLCSSCNVGLGSFQDKSRLLGAAAAYLNHYEALELAAAARAAGPEASYET